MPTYHPTHPTHQSRAVTEAKDAAAQLEKLGKQISAQTHDLAQMRSQLAAAAEALASSQVRVRALQLFSNALNMPTFFCLLTVFFSAFSLAASSHSSLLFYNISAPYRLFLHTCLHHPFDPSLLFPFSHTLISF
jgi:hypothetical protein